MMLLITSRSRGTRVDALRGLKDSCVRNIRSQRVSHADLTVRVMRMVLLRRLCVGRRIESLFPLVKRAW
jgi:hypothetical protein